MNNRLKFPCVPRYTKSLSQTEAIVKRRTPYIPIAKARGFTALSGKWNGNVILEYLFEFHVQLFKDLEFLTHCVDN